MTIGSVPERSSSKNKLGILLVSFIATALLASCAAVSPAITAASVLDPTERNRQQAAAQMQREWAASQEQKERQRQAEAERAKQEEAARQKEIERQRQAEVEQKERELAALQAEAERLRQEEAKVQDDPKERRIILSTNLCMRLQDEQEALDAIKAEKRAARLGGVVDLGILREHQDAVVAAKSVQGKLREDLRRIGLKSLGCDSKAVQKLWSCLAEPNRQDCQGPREQALCRLSDRWSGTSDRYEWLQERSRQLARMAAGEDK
jgi:hypothetical protein